jgi:hypothetical protein
MSSPTVAIAASAAAAAVALAAIPATPTSAAVAVAIAAAASVTATIDRAAAIVAAVACAATAAKPAAAKPAAAKPTAAKPASATAAAGTPLTRLVHSERSSVHERAVEGVGRCLRGFGGRHLDEAKAPGSTGLPVNDDAGRDDLAVDGEGILEARIGGRKRKIADVEAGSHGFLVSEWTLLSGAWCIPPGATPHRRVQLRDAASGRLFAAVEW